MNNKEETIIEQSIKLGEQKVLLSILYADKEEIYNLIEEFQIRCQNIIKNDCDCLDCNSDIPTPCKYKLISLDVLEENSAEELKKIIKC